MYEVYSINEKEDWDNTLNQTCDKDIFYFSDYCSLYKDYFDGIPHLFVYRDSFGRKVYYSFFKREINKLPFMKNSLPTKWFDIITAPYGYGGPLTKMHDKKLIKQFRTAFDAYCERENIVAEFIRFQPLLQNEKYLNEFMEICYDRETIYIDLTKTEEEIFKQYHKNHQRNVIKAKKNELTFIVFEKDDALNNIENFYILYKETMDKVKAARFSYFSADYIYNLLDSLQEHSFMGAVFHKGKMIAAAICLYANGTLHYHLGCSDKNYLHFGTNVFLLHNTALHGKSLNCQRFHLGGGHVGRDSLFQFKHRFHPNGILKFFIGKKVHNEEQYKYLLKQWERFYQTNLNTSFFPAYRYEPN